MSDGRDLDRRDEALALPEGVRSTETGLDFSSATKLGYDEWETLGTRLGRLHSGIQWWLGDWFRFGEARYRDGEMYQQALQETGRSVGGLYSLKWVAEKVQSKVRRSDLSWSHHREVAKLDPAEQVEWLARAADGRWSVDLLRDTLRDELGTSPRGEVHAPTDVADEDLLAAVRELRAEYGSRVTPELIREQVERRVHRELLAEQSPPSPADTPPFPDRRYRCLVIDPPWPVSTIARTHRPNQGGHLAYPTMPVTDIAALPIPRLADPTGCHVYLWTTHRFLPDALELFTAWGVRYECVLTWVKPSGFPVFNRWRFNSEFVVFGTAAPLPLLAPAIPVAFDAPNRGHSVKPDEFYALARRASPGPRLDMFARRRHDGFDAWGNEADGQQASLFKVPGRGAYDEEPTE